MKSLKILMIAVICIGVTSCLDAQFYKSVKGNGNVTKKERSGSNFDGIRVSSGIDVYLKQGDKESIVVEADDNLHEYIMTEIKGDVLNVYADVNIRDAEMKRVYVTMKDITSLKTSSAGDIIGETPIKTGNIEIGASSAGDIKIELYAKTAIVDISSSGDVTLTGEAESIEVSLSSAGDLSAFDFKTKQADVSVSSAGNAEVYVTEGLKARASSAGDIAYKGDPKNVDAHSSSAGGIHKR